MVIPMTKPRPLSSFDPKLLALLLRSAIEPLTLFAEDDHRRPTVVSKRDFCATTLTDTQITTRWHIVTFSTPSAAERFREFVRVSQRLHMLRDSLRYYEHPDADRAMTVRISLDDRRGTFTLGPADAALDDLLSSIDNLPTAGVLTHDPLTKI